MYWTLFNFGKRAFLENDPNAMRFIMQEGRQDTWEAVAIGASVQPGGTRWIMDHVWPSIPWVRIIQYFLSETIDNLNGSWFPELMTHVSDEDVFDARVHIPQLISEYTHFPENRESFWPVLWKVLDHVGARGLNRAIECAAGCRVLKRALIRYM